MLPAQTTRCQQRTSCPTAADLRSDPVKIFKSDPDWMKKQIRVLCCKSFFSCEKTLQLHWLLIRCVHYFWPCSSIFKNTWLFLDHAYWSEMDHCTVSRWVMIFESLTCFMFGHLFSECYLQNIKCWSLCFQLLRLNAAMNTVRL